jgi:alkylated DNA repair dioxygenase AlkB
LNGLVYEPDFLDPAEEASLLSAIGELPLHAAQYKQYTAKRRIASFGSEYDFARNQLLPGAPLPDFLLPLRAKAASWVAVAPQRFGHALVTQYPPGTELGWHRDVANFELVVGVSLLGWCRMRFRPYPPDKAKRIFKLDLAPRSAYVLRDEIRWNWQHSVAATQELRYSITFRTAR